MMFAFLIAQTKRRCNNGKQARAAQAHIDFKKIPRYLAHPRTQSTVRGSRPHSVLYRHFMSYNERLLCLPGSFLHVPVNALLKYQSTQRSFFYTSWQVRLGNILFNDGRDRHAVFTFALEFLVPERASLVFAYLLRPGKGASGRWSGSHHVWVLWICGLVGLWASGQARLEDPTSQEKQVVCLARPAWKTVR